ncbi:PepSY domain-containing protein [Comamonadaceae bacterium OH2545_COT-014]|nr:PepSY domain-containing protein [Comamonadaceae bacterium OH2545_COT-014]
MKFNLKTVVAATAAVAALAASPLAQAMNASQVIDTIQKNGYFATYELQKQYGHWTAKATSQQGVRSYMLVNDANGAFHAVSKADLGTRLPSAAQVADKLRAMGYAIVRDVDFENGLWEAEVRQHRNSPKIELLLHPVTLEVLNQPGPTTGGNNNPGHANGPVLTAQQVIQALQRAGYTHIHDLEFDDGRWEAEAINPAGQRVDLHINPYTGAVERERLDN